MQRISSTVLAVVDHDPDRGLPHALGVGANVRAVVPDPSDPPLDRAVAAWREAARTHLAYVVHDADPLAEVVDRWVERWDAGADLAGLDVDVQAVLARWRAGTLQLPDYYLVVDPEDLTPTRRHWYLGVLGAAAAHRVVVTSGEVGEVTRAVRHLRAGRWWPDLGQLLGGIDRHVPDAVHLDAPAEGDEDLLVT